MRGLEFRWSGAGGKVTTVTEYCMKLKSIRTRRTAPPPCCYEIAHVRLYRNSCANDDILCSQFRRRRRLIYLSMKYRAFNQVQVSRHRHRHRWRIIVGYWTCGVITITITFSISWSSLKRRCCINKNDWWLRHGDCQMNVKQNNVWKKNWCHWVSLLFT